MKPGKSQLPLDANEEVSALIATLHEAGQRLEELTGGEVDSVIDHGGRTFLFGGVQEQLRRIEDAKQAAILNALPAHIALLDTQGRIISVNEAWRQVACADAIQGPGHRIGLNYLEICDSARGDGSSEAHQVAEGIRSVLGGGVKSFSIEYPCHSPTEQRWFLLTATPLADDHPNGAVVMHIDITERKRSEDALHTSQGKYRLLIENLPQKIFLKDRQCVYLSCNENYARGLRIASRDIAGKTDYDFYPRELAERYRADDQRVMVTGVTEELDEPYFQDGKESWVHTVKAPVHNEAGERFGVLGIFWDITARKRAEKEIRSVSKFPAENPNPVLRIGRNGTVLFANQSSAPILTAWGRKVGQKVPDDWQKSITASIESGKSNEVEIACNGQIFSCNFAPILAMDYVNIYGRDITKSKQSEQDLSASEMRFRQIAENIRDVFFLIDTDSDRFLYVNPVYEELAGRSRESLYADPKSWIEALYPDDRASAYENYKKGKSGEAYEYECRTVRPDGSIRWFEVRGFPVRDDAGKIVRITGVAKDITEHKRTEIRIKRLNRVYAVLSGINTLIVRVRDRDELFNEACRIAVEQGQFKMAWIGVADWSAMTIVPVASAGAEPDFLTQVRDQFSLREDAPMGNTMTARAVREKKAIVSNDVRDGPKFFFLKERVERGIRSIAVLPLLVADDAVGMFALYADEVGFFDEQEMKLLAELASDIAFAIDHIGKQERLDYLAYYDALTGLANRSLFLERVAQHMRAAVSGGHKLVLYLIDLERFKNINDSLGRPAGDALLRQVAGWLSHIAGDANLLARVDADHFAAVLPEVKHEGDVARLLEKWMKAFLEHPFRLNDAVFRIALKVGIALFPDDGADADTLFKHAEAALKKAKARGERYLFYKQKMTEAVAGKLTLENQLRQAIDKEEFVLHYQPKVNLTSGKITSAEALIRWNDPRTGLVPPGRFIPILEETGLIYEVGRWALRKAIEDYLRWCAAGLAAVRIAVNVSPLQLRSRGFIAEVEQVIGIGANAADGLELELTESLIMEDVKRSIGSLQAIRALGVTIAIDDFGTGFSSLSYLAKLPVDTLKIDRSFVIDMTVAPEGLSLVSTIINLAHSLKLKVVAEGVETEEQSRLLRLLRCNEMQGFLFSKPVPAGIFEAKFLVAPPAG